MSIGGALRALAAWPAAARQLPRRTVRARLTLLYGGLFLVSGAALVAATYLLFQQATQYTKPRLPSIPHTPAIERFEPPRSLARRMPHTASLAGLRARVRRGIDAVAVVHEGREELDRRRPTSCCAPT